MEPATVEIIRVCDECAKPCFLIDPLGNGPDELIHAGCTASHRSVAKTLLNSDEAAYARINARGRVVGVASAYGKDQWS